MDTILLKIFTVYSHTGFDFGSEDFAVSIENVFQKMNWEVVMICNFTCVFKLESLFFTLFFSRTNTKHTVNDLQPIDKKLPHRDVPFVNKHFVIYSFLAINTFPQLFPLLNHILARCLNEILLI